MLAWGKIFGPASCTRHGVVKILTEYGLSGPSVISLTLSLFLLSLFLVIYKIPKQGGRN